MRQGTVVAERELRRGVKLWERSFDDDGILLDDEDVEVSSARTYYIKDKDWELLPINITTAVDRIDQHGLWTESKDARRQIHTTNTKNCSYS
jgi:hypothetical protein